MEVLRDINLVGMSVLPLDACPSSWLKKKIVLVQKEKKKIDKTLQQNPSIILNSNMDDMVQRPTNVIKSYYF